MTKRYLHNANSSKVSDRAIRCSNRCWTDILGCTNRSWLDPLGCSNRCWIDRSIRMLQQVLGARTFRAESKRNQQMGIEN